jgi:hypothetical protein
LFQCSADKFFFLQCRYDNTDSRRAAQLVSFLGWNLRS